MRLQVPVPDVIVTVVPAMEQAPPAASVTARPEVAVAVTEKLLLNTALAGAPVKLIVWLALAREKH